MNNDTATLLHQKLNQLVIQARPGCWLGMVLVRSSAYKMSISDCIEQIREQGFYTINEELKNCFDKLQEMKQHKVPTFDNKTFFQELRQYEKEVIAAA